MKKDAIENQLAVVILAAGKGKRMNSKKVNKILLPLFGRPMIFYTLDLLKDLGLKKIIVVVGFAKESVKKTLGTAYIYAEQTKRLGTAHAVECALDKIPPSFKDILVLNGDDSAFYSKRIINNLIQKHREQKAAMTLLTIETENPAGLGRVLRRPDGGIAAIVEEKDAPEKYLKIREVNPACYVFLRSFLKKYLPKIPKSPYTGEYYLTDLVKLGVDNKEKVTSFKVKNIPWRGVNTFSELQEAERMMKDFKYGN